MIFLQDVAAASAGCLFRKEKPNQENPASMALSAIIDSHRNMCKCRKVNSEMEKSEKIKAVRISPSGL